MKAIRNYIGITLLGGFLVVLPLSIFVGVLVWLFKLISGWLSPITELIVQNADINHVMAQALSITIILVFCFAMGMMASHRIGSAIFDYIEDKFLRKLPGYPLIKDALAQFLTKDRTSFKKVALVDIYGTGALMTAFVTDEHPDGTYTVYVPTAPNPTSGNIYHVRENQLHLVDVPAQTAMRSVVSCGAGSTPIIIAMNGSVRTSRK